MSNSERELSLFIRREVWKNRRDGQLERFILRHAQPGSKGSDVDDFDLPEGFTSDMVERFVEDITTRAQSDANGMGPGVHRYVLHAVIDGKSIGRQAFRIRGDDEEFDEGTGEDAPTMKGLLTQLMRHNEAQARTMNAGINGIVGMLVRNLESRDRTLETLIEQRQKDLEVLESARSQEHEREMQLLLESGAETRKDKVFEHINGLIPIVINRIAGQPMMSVTEKSALKGLVDSLTPEQFDKIRGSLEPAQQIVLLQAIKSIQDEEKKLTDGAS